MDIKKIRNGGLAAIILASVNPANAEGIEGIEEQINYDIHRQELQPTVKNHVKYTERGKVVLVEDINGDEIVDKIRIGNCEGIFYVDRINEKKDLGDDSFYQQFSGSYCRGEPGRPSTVGRTGFDVEEYQQKLRTQLNGEE